MSLALDARQRAMLQEMGVRVWLPPPATEAVNEVRTLESVPVPVPETAPGSMPLASPVVKVPATPRLPSPTLVNELVQGIGSMDWPALTETIYHCQACAMCLGRRAPSLTAPALVTPCDWLVVGDPPDEAQERAGQPFVDAAGLLLDNMLRAVAVQRWNHEAGAAPASAARAYLTHVLKCRPALMRAPDGTELSTCAHFLRREIALTQPRVILAMGRFAMQLLLSETPPEQARLPLGKLRGKVWHFANVPVVVTYPPTFLLRNGADKGKAWADLCLASAVASGSLTSP